MRSEKRFTVQELVQVVILPGQSNQDRNLAFLLSARRLLQPRPAGWESLPPTGSKALSVCPRGQLWFRVLTLNTGGSCSLLPSWQSFQTKVQELCLENIPDYTVDVHISTSSCQLRKQRFFFTFLTGNLT